LPSDGLYSDKTHECTALKMHAQCSPEGAYRINTQRAIHVTTCFFNYNTKRITAVQPDINTSSKDNNKKQIKLKIKRK
jgi:hypothetical protein